MKKLLLFSITFLFNCSCVNDISGPIEKFQQSLVDSGTTGSNVFKLYKDGDIVYDKIINSNANGDKDIDENNLLLVYNAKK